MKKMHYAILFIALLFSIIIMPNSVSAANTVINANDMTAFTKTKKDIQKKWESGELNLPDGYSIYSTEPAYEAPYSGGVVKQEYLDNVLANLNYYRYLIGSPEITTKISNREDLQAAVVCQYLSLKSGNSLSHNLSSIFSKPDDMEQDFYNLGVTASHNIISSYTYASPIKPFFSESYFTSTSGHRTALLSPSTSKAEFGLGKVTYGYAVSTSTFSYDQMESSIAAYPSPGYFPKQDMSTVSDWDIYLNANDFSSLTTAEKSNVTATIKCINTGKTYTYRVADDNLYIGTTLIHIKHPEKDTTYYEGNYEVTVTNLKDKDGNYVDLKYTVKFFDKFEGIESNVYSVTYGDNMSSSISMDGNYNEKVVKKVLPKTATINLESGASITVDISSYTITDTGYDWIYQTYKCVAKFKNIPSWVKDENNILSNGLTIYIPCYYVDKYSDFDYTKTTFKAKLGENVTISATYNGVYGNYSNYKWIKRNSDGSVEVLKNSSKYKIDDQKLTIKNLETSDNNTSYYLVNATDVSYLSASPMYISKKLKLKITDAPPEKVTGVKVSSQTTSSIKIKWNEVSDATGYKVYKYNSSTQKYDYIASTTKTSYNIKDLKAGKVYKFKVKAYKKVDGKKINGSKSDYLKASTKPKSTKITKTTVGKNKVTLKWNKVSNADGYAIYMSTSKNGTYEKIKTISSNQTVTYTKKSLDSGKKYYFKIRAYKKVNDKKVYSSYSKIVKTNSIK